jgi:hypothetical protein
MNSREASLLRTRLRQVNIEYSTLVRDQSGEGHFLRLAELRSQRRALMALLFDGANKERSGHAPRVDVMPQHGAERLGGAP